MDMASAGPAQLDPEQAGNQPQRAAMPSQALASPTASTLGFVPFQHLETTTKHQLWQQRDDAAF